jgi:hypothetical protein
MRQCYVSESLSGLNYKDKYGFNNYTDSLEHLYLFGLYREYELEIIKNHNGRLTIIWCGSDAKDLSEEWVTIIKNKKINHISISETIQKTLLKHSIHSKVIYLTAVQIIPELSNHPNGDFIYFYSSDNAPNVYNEEYIPYIIEKTKIPIIRGSIGVYSKKDLYNIYQKSFLNLRLTTHDGTPHTNLEMGLMGRKSIFNGELPYSIKWDSIDDICDNIMKEYENRHNDNTYVSEKYIKFIKKNVI